MHVAIVGGGISGLTVAYDLGRRGIPCTLYESEPHLGGVIRSTRVEGCLVEGGPDSWLAEKTWLLDLLREIGVEDQVIGSNNRMKKTFIVRKGQLVQLPASMRLLAPSRPWQICSSKLFSPATKLRMFHEWFRNPADRQDRSVAEFVRDHFGDEAVEYLAQPMLAGVYGAQPEDLSARQVIPRFVEYEKQYGSILKGVYQNRRNRLAGSMFLSLRNGMGSLVHALEHRIAGHCEVVNGCVQKVWKVNGRWQLQLESGAVTADHVVIATPAHVASALLRESTEEMSRLLDSIVYGSSITVSLIYAREHFRHSLNGFGMLVPRIEGRSIAACTWVNSKFEGRVPQGSVLLRAFLAGDSTDRMMSAEDEVVLELVHRELGDLMQYDSQYVRGQVYRWKQAMPQYAVGHEAVVQKVEANLAHLPGLHLAGNGFRGLGIPDCVLRSRQIVETIASAGA